MSEGILSELLISLNEGPSLGQRGDFTSSKKQICKRDFYQVRDQESGIVKDVGNGLALKMDKCILIFKKVRKGIVQLCTGEMIKKCKTLNPYT